MVRTLQIHRNQNLLTSSLLALSQNHKTLTAAPRHSTKPRFLPCWLFASQSQPSLEGPLVLPPNFLLLLRCEVVDDVEGLADLLRSLALDHVGDRLTGQVEEPLDLQVVRSQDEVEEDRLVDFDEVLVEGLEVHLVGLDGGGGGGGVGGGGGCVPVQDVLLAVVDDLDEDIGADVGERDDVVGAAVIHQVLDGLRRHGHRHIHHEHLVVGALEREVLHRRRCRVRRHRSDRRGGGRRGFLVVVRGGKPCGGEAEAERYGGLVGARSDLIWNRGSRLPASSSVAVEGNEAEGAAMAPAGGGIVRWIGRAEGGCVRGRSGEESPPKPNKP